MKKVILIKNKIEDFNKEILVSGDKSISIRWVLFSSIAEGNSTAINLLMSEDVLAAISAVKKLGIKVRIFKNSCVIYGKGIDGYNYKKNLIINAKNSGTLGRLILGLLINTPYKIKLIGDNSLSKRDFRRVAEPLRKFGAKINLNRNKTLPLTIKGIQNPVPINYHENRGSAQCKSAIILAGLRTEGKTLIKAKKSRNHTELFAKQLMLPVKVTNKKKSKLLIKNVNINPSRTGVIKILKMMGVNITYKNKKIYNGELVADLFIKSAKKLRCINCPQYLNSGAIDEFLLIFLVAAKAKGISTFKNLSELNEKESPRLDWGAKILNKMGIKTIKTKDSLKIYGNPNIIVNKKIIIKDFLKDHRVFMTSVIAALSFGGSWKIYDTDSIKTSFPSFINIINELKK